jgi:hypothetical protein
VRQEAIGHRGMFQCMNATQKPMTIGEFKKLALKDENLLPLQEHELAWTPEQRAKADFWDLEKKYWQSISPKPPVYGADNFSASFFEDCAGAWSVSLCAPLRWLCSLRPLGLRPPPPPMGAGVCACLALMTAAPGLPRTTRLSTRPVACMPCTPTSRR